MKIIAPRTTLLKAIIVTLPFGWVSILPIPYTNLTFVLMYLYIALAVLDFPQSLNTADFKRYFQYLLLMWFVMVSSTTFDSGAYAFGSWSQLRQIIFFTVFFMFAVPNARHMFSRGQSIERYFLIAMLGMVVVYFGGFTSEQEVTGRVSLEGVNANVLGLYSATSVLILLDVVVRRKSFDFSGYWVQLALPLMLLLVYILYHTGSRGGVLILTAGIFVYFLGWKRMTKKQFGLLLLAMPVALLAIWILFTSGQVAERMTLLQENIRIERIWPAAFEVFKAYPILGAGFDRTSLMLQDSIGFFIAIHSEFLKVLTASGLVGMTFFCLFLLQLIRQSVEYRKRTGSALRLALMLVVILQLGKGGGALQLPFIWVMFLLLTTLPGEKVAAKNHAPGKQATCVSGQKAGSVIPVTR